MRKARLGKVKDLSELGIRAENFSVINSVLTHYAMVVSVVKTSQYTDY